MKRFTAFLLMLSTIIATVSTLSAYASPEPSTAPRTSAVTEMPSPAPSPSETEEPPSTEEPPITEPLPPETEELTVEEIIFQGLYTAIDSAAAEYLYPSPEPLSDTLLASVCTKVLQDVPHFFYLEAIVVETTELETPDEDGNLYRYRLILEYNIAPGEELDAAKAFVNEQTAAILASIPEGASQLEQLIYLHDYICVNFAYDTANTVRDIYRFLKDGIGVCQSYAGLYAHLLNQLGIENCYVTSQEMNHLWNLVKLDGLWYHVDITWDDPITDQAGRALHQNFLRSDSGIASTGHTGFIAPYICSSTIYETSFLPELYGALVFLPRYCYGFHSSQRMLLQIDLDRLTATPVVDLSELRWRVWDKPETLWKEQYIGLYTDGYYIYFNGPASVWIYDPELMTVSLLFEYDATHGYLYSLRGAGHQLTCTVSTKPGAAQSAAYFSTSHYFESEGGDFFSTESCLICQHTEAFLIPVEGDFITACLSIRPSGDALHDLRLNLLLDTEMEEANLPLTVRLALYNGEEVREIIRPLSPEDHSDFLIYERIRANGLEYSAAEGYQIYGLILLALENGSYDRIEVTITAPDAITAEEVEIYRSALTWEALIDPPSPDDDESDESGTEGDDPEEGVSEEGESAVPEREDGTSQEEAVTGTDPENSGEDDSESLPDAA